MAMPFGYPDLDTVYREHFKPAVAQCGFDLRRIDEKPPAGSIDNRLRVEIRRSHFLVVDLTHHNRGAYWEAGFAEGLGKSVIFTCEETHFCQTHFDTNHQQTIRWSLPEIEKAVSNLKDMIRVTLPAEARLSDA
jgi:nucleoside 2-deoxyribosyltransferase